ncbi:hypothetical protein WKI68_23725 [Streptomyces sp. MS1.HAVA.3]|uniref:Uncharacterized protein n=1 Tax=Streptomyces caledonius TaxID=3134107 RepID=A0ABU8U6T8_9ACTN
MVPSTPSTADVYNSGPVRRLLDLAIGVQESGGALSLDDELRRYIRAIRASWIARTHCEPYTAAALLDLVAQTLDVPGAAERTPEGFRERMARAAGDMDWAQYLRMLSGLVRILDREPPAFYDELPLGGWESHVTFPHLGDLPDLLFDGQLPGATFAEALTAYVTREHPFCDEHLAPVAAEAQHALVLFPGKQSYGGWTRAGLLQLLATINDHMAAEHA